MPQDGASSHSGLRKPALGADLVIPAVALCFAIYFFFSIAELAWEAKANATLIGTVLIVLVAVQAVRVGMAVARGEGNLRLDTLWQPRDVLGRRIGMVLITAAFIALLPWLGLTLALFLALLAALYLMGVRQRARLVLVPLCAAAIAYLMFIALLASEFPHGPVERLLALLF